MSGDGDARILVVDDVPENVRLLEAVLAPRGYESRPAGRFLIEQRLYAEVEDDIEVEPVGEVTLEGFRRPVAAFNVVAVRETAGEPSQA